ncbi:hypothetical protein MSPP1_001635 [Malassezia sp. CBS 17886]|nr:hypothetical protein MSPP1_001635 [Malassezia sp. CBS 17886]
MGSFEELRRIGLQQTAEQQARLREQLAARAEESKSSAVLAAQRARDRASWLARERKRKRQEAAESEKRDTAAEEAQRAAAARCAEKAAAAKAVGRSSTARTPAFQKAKAHAEKQRTQVRRPAAQDPRPSAALTRDEKRQQRMARAIGVPVARARPREGASSEGRSRAAVPHAESPPARRPATARERFLAEEARRKQARAASAESLSSASDDESSHSSPPRAALRDEIWALFGRDRQRYMAHDVDSEDDMEAGADDVLTEEVRSAAAARREDEREAELLEAARQRKHHRAV